MNPAPLTWPPDGKVDIVVMALRSIAGSPTTLSWSINSCPCFCCLGSPEVWLGRLERQGWDELGFPSTVSFVNQVGGLFVPEETTVGVGADLPKPKIARPDT